MNINRNDTNWSRSVFNKIKNLSEHKNIDAILIREEFQRKQFFPFPPITFTCFMQSEVQHSFTEDEFNKLAQNKENEIIVQNDFSATHSDYINLDPINENLLIFIRDDQPIDNIDLQDLQKILKGDIKNWKEIGGTDTTITIYKLSPVDSEDKKILTKRYNLILSKINIDETNKPTQTHLASSYKKLHNRCIKDSGTLVMGIRGVTFQDLKPVDIDNIVKNNNQENYPLKIKTTISIRKNINNEKTKRILNIMNNRQKSDLLNIIRKINK